MNDHMPGRMLPSIEADIIAPTFWMAARFVQLGWAQKLPVDKIPNMANLRDDLKGQPWDKDQQYNLPWQTGIAGIAYNAKATGRELKSVEDLFDPAFKGKIGMLTEMRDTMGLVLMGLGKNISEIATFDPASVDYRDGTSYIVQCNLHYPPALFDATDSFPLGM